MSRDTFNFHWIENGRVLAGSIPNSGADIQMLRSMGIQAVLHLTRRDPADCADIARALVGMSRLHTPIIDCGIPDDATRDQAIDFIDHNRAARQPIYVHCRGGVGRTGCILIAYYVLRYGLDLDQAKDLVAKRHNLSGTIAGTSNGSPQAEWIAALGEHR